MPKSKVPFEEKEGFVREFLTKNASAGVALVQNAVRKAFGEGVNFKQMGELFRKYSPNYKGGVAGRKPKRKPGRPPGSGRKPGRPPGSGRKPGRPPGSGRKPGRPPGSGAKPGRPPGRPPGSVSGAGMLLLIGEQGTLFASRAEAVTALNRHLNGGGSISEVRLYKLVATPIRFSATV
ncbi:MAG: hypothetical protein HZA54_20250 [Planctomycetes bacterium]|nr:hypothetical protein [Planctomycetota bacterium]